MRSAPRRSLRAGCVGALLAVGVPVATEAADRSATWIGGTGPWSEPSNWSTDPDVPDNDGTSYAATIGPSAGPVELDLHVVLDSLALLSSDLGVRTGASFDLNLVDGFTWDGGRHAGGGTTSVGGLAVLTGSPWLDGRTLVLEGPTDLRADLTLANGASVWNRGVFEFDLNSADLLGATGAFTNEGWISQRSLSNANVVEGTWTQTSSGTLSIRRSFRLRNHSFHDGTIELLEGLVTPDLQLGATAASGPTQHVFGPESTVSGPGRILIVGASSADTATARFEGALDLSGGSWAVRDGEAEVHVRNPSDLGVRIDINTDGTFHVVLDEAPAGSSIEFALPDTHMTSRGRLRISENETPLPVDRVFLKFNRFSASGVTRIEGPPGVPPGRYGMAIETAFLSGQLGLDTPFPMEVLDLSLAPFTTVDLGEGSGLALSTTGTATFGGAVRIAGDETTALEIRGAVAFDAPPESNPLETLLTPPTFLTGGPLVLHAGAQVTVEFVKEMQQMLLEMGPEARAEFNFPDPTDFEAVRDVAIRLQQGFFVLSHNAASLGAAFSAGGQGDFHLTEIVLELIGEEPVFLTDARVEPGTSAGALTFSGPVALLPGSVHRLEIGGLLPDTEHDQVVYEDGVTLGGDLEIRFLDGFEAEVEPSDAFFVLLAGGEILGAFGNVAGGARLATADGLGSFRVDYGAGSPFGADAVVLSDFAPVPEPVAAGLAALLAGLAVIGRRRAGRIRCVKTPRRRFTH